MVVKPKFGTGLSCETLDSLDKYVLITMPEPWEIIEKQISNKPEYLEFNYNMSMNNLEKFYDSFEPFITDNYAIVGIGGGTACDTAKFLTWKFKEEFNFDLELYLIPSIISVDAFLCSSVAIREENRVKYIGESTPKGIIIDFELIKEAPKYLNRAGVSDTISITSALGDWLIAKDEINEKFDQKVFDQAKSIVFELLDSRIDIGEVNDKGIKALVDGFYNEVLLCEEWGNARPEEGSEHFLAYCLESITKEHYIHGNLIGLNILISLYLQEEYAQFSVEELQQFFNEIKLEYAPKNQNIAYIDLKTALKQIKQYVIDENLHYTIYNSPNLNLNEKVIEDLTKFIKKI